MDLVWILKTIYFSQLMELSYGQLSYLVFDYVKKIQKLNYFRQDKLGQISKRINNDESILKHLAIYLLTCLIRAPGFKELQKVNNGAYAVVLNSGVFVNKLNDYFLQDIPTTVEDDNN